MYKISVPIMSSTVNEKNRERYVQLCREAGAERIFFAVASVMEPISPSLAENVAYFRSQGFAVGIWTDSIGHGKVLDHVENATDDDTFAQIVDITGSVRHHASCPMGASFQAYLSNRITELADTGAEFIMLDDDFRMSQHGGELCCACPMHLGRMAEWLGEEISLEKIRPYVLSGKPNKYRDAWLHAQNEGLLEMARSIRAEVDKKHIDVTVCLCTASSVWNVDGTDIVAISKILAGENKPILRLTGAPYWAYSRSRRFSLVTVMEVARMLASFVDGEGFDLMSEGDVYPRPRYTCPASYLELYDAATRADGGYSGILKYMFDYVAGPELETGYLHFHKENTPFLEKIHALFPNGANAGVRIVTHPHTFKDADLDRTVARELSPMPVDGTMLASCGIPTVYRGEGICNSVFGENARSLDECLMDDGLILDAVSAMILTERGVDVGLSEYSGLDDKKISFVCTNDSEYKSFVDNGSVRFLNASLKTEAEPLLFSASPCGKETIAYRYENAKGQRFLVFLFEGESIGTPMQVCMSGILKNYATQRVLAQTVPWVARQPIPAYCVGNPDLYLMCEQDGDAMSVVLFNCFADPLVNPTIILDEKYDSIECIRCEAELSGNRVTLCDTLHGFSYAMFRVRKNERSGCL